jgi:hypothetical protein
MKNYICYLYILLILFSCQQKTKKSNVHFVEENLNYGSEIRHIESKNDIVMLISSYKSMGFPENDNWIRKWDNIKLLNDIFKKIGYKKIISDSIYFSKNDSNWINKDSDWYNLSYSNIIDSLIIYKKGNIKKGNYFSEFWERRKKDKNEMDVYNVVLDIKKNYEKKEKVEALNISDLRLYSLIKANLEYLDNKKYNEYINVLKHYDLNQSVYFLTERNESHNNDSIIKLLKKDSVNNNKGRWVFEKDKGP